jgi:predicted dehydrogenase
VAAVIERDPHMKIDRLTSAILDFPAGQSIFTCGTQIVPYQRMQIFGTRGRIEIEIPFNAPPDRPCRVVLDDGRDLFGVRAETHEIPMCDQYTVQGDLFSRAVRDGGDVPVSLESSIRNMAVIDAVVRAAESGKWEDVQA